jgi:alkanesulfonate monooxygenase SsuD/methylene tetrahydromethanopterin reductase-like flavin-dependent oxidoreductase (luciferase family)
MEPGLYTFAELAPHRAAGRRSPPLERLRDPVEEVELANEVGLDVFGVGEHHRPDFAVSAPAVVLAAAAERSSRIRLTSAVSILSSDDPVRAFQEFSTLDLLSGARAEIMAVRARSSSRSRSSATTSTTARRSSPRSSSCCWSCASASG